MKTAAANRRIPLLAVPSLVAAALSVSGATVSATSAPDDSTPDETTANDDTTVVVLDEGKGDDRFDLKPPMVVGTVARAVETTTTAGTLQLVGAQSFDATVHAVTTVEQTAEVLDSEPDGSYTIQRTVDSYDFVVTEGPAEIANGFKDDEELEALVGVPLEQRYDPEGRLVDVVAVGGARLTAEQEASIETLLEEGGDRPPFPDLEVGVGAVWTAQIPGTSAAGGAARYELTAIENGQATIEMTFEGDSSTLETLLVRGMDEITGEFGGEGTLTASVKNPLESTFEFSLGIDVVMSGSLGEMTMDVDSTSSRVVTLE